MPAESSGGRISVEGSLCSERAGVRVREPEQVADCQVGQDRAQTGPFIPVYGAVSL